MSSDQHTDAAAAAFTRQSVRFDGIYGSNAIVQYKRERVRAHLSHFLLPGSKVLEWNSGTGEDALWLASQGHKVQATDLSEGMLAVLRQKVTSADANASVRVEQCSFLHMDKLTDQGPYDAIFSNFGGLNCTPHLEQVLGQADALLKPGGTLTIVLISPFCLWENLLLLRGEWRTATRRWFARKGSPAMVEGQAITCYYYKPVFIREALGTVFKMEKPEGLCILVPPSYREHFPKRFPRLYRFLQKAEAGCCRRWPWRNWGDYYIMTLRKSD